MDALARHRGERDAQFEWYARLRIRGAIVDELRQQDWLSRRARSLATRTGSGEAAPAVVAMEDLGHSARVHELRDDDLAERHSERVALSDAVKQLPPRERSLIELHYLRGAQLKEIADLFGVSLPRVSQLHARAIGKLREILASGQGEDWKASA
jgi:RNA polymerase sigma factor for flagellar operon FliA